MPFPKRHGGTTVVPACIDCHDLKDRFSMEEWPPEMLAGMLTGITTRESRIWLARAIGVVMDYEARAKDAERQLHELRVRLGEEDPYYE
jgi:hypothetical protein